KIRVFSSFPITSEAQYCTGRGWLRSSTQKKAEKSTKKNCMECLLSFPLSPLETHSLLSFPLSPLETHFDGFLKYTASRACFLDAYEIKSTGSIYWQAQSVDNYWQCILLCQCP
ncbi:unnamed protein product, partial [Laminaria digitata]